eukprot:6205943-Pleurochrysis_carterae.AAC.3
MPSSSHTSRSDHANAEEDAEHGCTQTGTRERACLFKCVLGQVHAKPLEVSQRPADLQAV